MSVSVQAHAIIGVKLEINGDMFGTNRRPTCDHFDTISEWDDRHFSKVNFCPTCGAKVEQDDTKFSQFDSIGEFVDHLETECEKRFPNLLNVAFGYEYDGVCVGYSTEYADTYTDSIQSRDLSTSIDNIKAALKELLEDYELYNEDSFGLHVVLYFG